MKVGDIVKCVCAINTWYKGVPGIIVDVTAFSTSVLIKGKIIDLCSSQLVVVNE